MLCYRNYLLCIGLLMVFSSCRKQAFEDYYGRPDWLESAIYTKMQEEGRFSHILKLIDKAGYTTTLNEAGYWTFFAPNDEAVNAFLREQGIGSIDDVSEELANKIVRYALVYNAFKTDRISDYQSGLGWVEGLSFRRRTAYYDGFQKQTVKVNGVDRELIIAASNRNNASVVFGTPYYIDGDNNNKYVTYFHSKYAALHGLTASDYSFFYPGQSWTDFNFMGAKVVKADIIAENGVIHEVNAVTLPQLSLDQYLAEHDDYSFFRDSILNRYFVTYEPSAAASKTYEYRTGQVAEVFVKVYDPMLSFSLNNENYLKMEDNDGQQGSYSMFVPKNDVLIPWVRNELLQHYRTLSNVPKSVLADFVNTFLWKYGVWPSQFADQANEHGEPARFEFTDIADKKVLSNGFFYGTSKLQESDLFNTVYKYMILDPDYSLMQMVLDQSYKSIVTNSSKQYTVFLFSNRLLSQLGYNYSERLSTWTWIDRSNNTIGHNIVQPRLQRILYTHIVETPNDELANIATTRGYIQAGDESLPGEYIKWDNGRIYAAGNEMLNLPVQVVGQAKFGNNGRIYYVDNLLEFSAETAGQAITRIVAANANLSRFRDYLINSRLYRATDHTIAGIAAGSSFTFLLPNNAAIQQAIDDDLLPATHTPTTLPEQILVEKFIQYHILTNINIAPDGNPNYTFGITLLKDQNDQPINLRLQNSVNNLRFTDERARTISVVNNPNLYMSNRMIFHELDGYLNYND